MDLPLGTDAIGIKDIVYVGLGFVVGAIATFLIYQWNSKSSEKAVQAELKMREDALASEYDSKKQGLEQEYEDKAKNLKDKSERERRDLRKDVQNERTELEKLKGDIDGRERHVNRGNAHPRKHGFNTSRLGIRKPRSVIGTGCR